MRGKTIPRERMREKPPKVVVEEPVETVWYKESEDPWDVNEHSLRKHFQALVNFVRVTPGWKSRTCDIHPGTLMKLWVKQGGKCALSGLPLTLHSLDVPSARMAAVDIKSQKRGNVKGNVRLVCYPIAASRRYVAGGEAMVYRETKRRGRGYKAPYKVLAIRIPHPNLVIDHLPRHLLEEYPVYGAVICAYLEHVEKGRHFHDWPLALSCPFGTRDGNGDSWLNCNTYLLLDDGKIVEKELVTTRFDDDKLVICQRSGDLWQDREVLLADPAVDLLAEIDGIIREGYRRYMWEQLGAGQSY